MSPTCGRDKTHWVDNGPYSESIVVLCEHRDLFPHLEVRSGFGCTYCLFVSQCTISLRQHYDAQHAAVRRRRGGLKNADGRAVSGRLDQE